jgi:CRP/FNR family transcriptional regulator
MSLYHVSRGGTCPINILSVLLKRPTSACARALSEITAITLPADYFRRCVIDSSVIRDFAFSAMADRLADVIDLVEHITFCTLEQRLAGYLCCQFDGQNSSAAPVLAITHDQIAAELGSAREVVSRLLRDLERKGGVSLGRGHIRLNDINLLKNIHNYSHH